MKSAVRALAIIDLLAQRGRPLRFPEIARALGYPQSSLHGLMKTLQQAQWIELDENTREYTVGIRAWEAGQAYKGARTLAERARPYMDAIRDRINETVQLAVLDNGRHNVYLAKSEGDQRLVLESRVGSRLPAHATGVGKVLLAALDDDDVRQRIGDEKLEQYTTTTPRDLDDLLSRLRRVREAGYGTDDQEYTEGVRCVAVPVHAYGGETVAAMSVSVPVVRFDAALEGAALAALRAAAADLSHALGYREETSD